MSWSCHGNTTAQFFDAALAAKWLHIWNVCSAICSTKMSVSWWVLVRFWIFKNPYESSCVLPCPGHVLGMSWACPGYALGMFKSCQRHPATHFFNFFQFFFSIFFNLFAKNQLFYVKFVTLPPCSELFTWILFIIFHILATEAPST